LELAVQCLQFALVGGVSRSHLLLKVADLLDKPFLYRCLGRRFRFKLNPRFSLINVSVYRCYGTRKYYDTGNSREAKFCM
jgi:hypothetical protein